MEGGTKNNQTGAKRPFSQGIGSPGESVIRVPAVKSVYDIAAIK
jgi:hypothetical protein